MTRGIQKRALVKRPWRDRAVIATIVLAILSAAYAQKTEVGYDKQANFAQFKTYSWVPLRRHVERPLLVANIQAAIDEQLRNKGFQRVESNPDLLVNAAGNIGMEGAFTAADPRYPGYGGYPPLNATVWTGPVSSAPTPLVGKGVLMVDVIDAKQKHLVWRGMIKENLDPNKKTKAMDQVNRAIAKLFSNYPPKNR